MILYKYVPAERISILQDFLIRFTQPNAMNDPFEARPDSYMTKEGRAKELANVIKQATTDLDMYADRVEQDPDFAEELFERMIYESVLMR